MISSASLLSPTKGRVLLHDSLVFVILCCASVTLFVVTLFLFHSFEEHRARLAQQWTARGRSALQSGRPTDAVMALRVALSYDPNNRPDQFMLAQALAASGHQEEAMNYFLTLWEQRPGEGITNLQLARLERTRGDAAEAINYYRAAIFGSWEGDGSLRRRETRLELADYFKQRGNDAAARSELLIAAGNAPPEEYLEVSLGDRLESIGDPSDALQLYTKALQQDPHRRSALIKAGRAAYQLNDYANAARLLQTALHEPATRAAPASEDPELEAMVATSLRIPELNLSRELPPSQRAEHLLLVAGIARRRLAACSADGTDHPTPERITDLADLQARWKALAPTLQRGKLERDSTAADTAAQLAVTTEVQTFSFCRVPPSGDDTLLMKQADEAQPGENIQVPVASAGKQ